VVTNDVDRDAATFNRSSLNSAESLLCDGKRCQGKFISSQTVIQQSVNLVRRENVVHTMRYIMLLAHTLGESLETFSYALSLYPPSERSERRGIFCGGVWKCKYGKMKYDWAGVENASTNSAGKVKHNNLPIILRSGKQLSPFSLNLWNFKKSAYDKIQC